jgi:tetratricopeptide (TPR) repeat protein
VGLKTPNWRRAVQHFHRAAQLDPAYRSREYFWSELAAIFFNAGRFHWAAKAYRKAFALDELPALCGPLADSLWRIGQYNEATKFLASVPDADPNESPQWLLLKHVIGHVNQAAGCSTQKRDPKRASEFLTDAEGSADVTAKEEYWRAALRCDGLCATAWWNLSVEAAKAGRHHDARAGFIICGLINPEDIEAWTNSLAAGRAVKSGTEEDVLLFALCILTAARTNRDGLYREMVARYKSGGQQDLGEVSRRVRELISAAPARKQTLALRLHNEDGSVDELHGQFEGIE